MTDSCLEFLCIEFFMAVASNLAAEAPATGMGREHPASTDSGRLHPLARGGDQHRRRSRDTPGCRALVTTTERGRGRLKRGGAPAISVCRLRPPLEPRTVSVRVSSKARWSPRLQALALPYRRCVWHEAATTVATLTVALRRAQHSANPRGTPKGTGPSAGACLPRPRCTAGTRLLLCAWLGGLLA